MKENPTTQIKDASIYSHMNSITRAAVHFLAQVIISNFESRNINPDATEVELLETYSTNAQQYVRVDVATHECELWKFDDPYEEMSLKYTRTHQYFSIDSLLDGKYQADFNVMELAQQSIPVQIISRRHPEDFTCRVVHGVLKYSCRQPIKSLPNFARISNEGLNLF